MERCFAILNASDERITALAVSWFNNGYKIENMCYASADGFKKGRVSDVATATDSVGEVLDKLREKTGKKIQQIYAGVSSSSIDVISSLGMIVLSKYGREVFQKDIKKCMENASAVKISLNREILHRVISGFFIDGERVKDPLGLEGVKMGIELNIFTIYSSVLNNMAKSIAQAGFIPKVFVFSGIASANRVLTGEDKEKGVILLDIGRDLIEILFFRGGNLVGCKILSIGIDEIWRDQEKADINNLKLLVSEINNLLKGEKPNKAVLVNDNTSIDIDGFVEILEVNFKFPIEMGSCRVRPLEDLPVERDGYIKNLGILDYLLEEKKKEGFRKNIAPAIINKLITFCDSYF